ncbi:hypothetical protein VTJ49DRAFT_2230 [Mycothermus thermophilus]|uniref:Uncharacterized protein n=1 Tax=Humicola insolens TaxID=85995 RepID=A0ABR3VAL7_HUMIN
MIEAATQTRVGGSLDMTMFGKSSTPHHRDQHSQFSDHAADNKTDQSGRTGRRRPFSALMKKLANLKAASDSRYSASKRSGTKKHLNNPYPQSGFANVNIQPRHSRSSVSTGPSSSLGRADSTRRYSDEPPPTANGARSVAPTVSTEHDACRSIIATSHGESSLAGTSRTTNGRRGGDSTFSSPAPSVRSLATTLTTIQTVAPNGGGAHHAHHHSHASTSQTIHFHQPFPTGPPASAIPPHLAGSTSPAGPGAAAGSFQLTTYASATANNLLTDNASILTLASSSKRRRRRHSLDTDASVRALAPSSLWGGSRESLPLSVLSATLEGAGTTGGAPPPPTPGGGAGLHRAGGSASVGGGANERASIYSATGILGTAAAATSMSAGERSSFYAGKGPLGSVGGGVGGDAASVRSGLLGHGRQDSANGSIGGTGATATGTSPLATPREVEAEKEKEVGEREKDE